MAEKEKLMRLIEEILKECPSEEPERYEGQNTGDCFDNGIEFAYYWVGRKINKRLKEMDGE